MDRILDEHLETMTAREAYAQNFCPPSLSENELIDKYDLPWTKHP